MQWGKFLFRKIKKKKVSKDPGAKRANVPAYFVECYYLLWLAVQIIIYNFVPFDADNHKIITGVCRYYVFESVAWVIYYTVLRRFFEEKYSINHILEYLVVLLILVPAQALAFSNINGFAFSDCLLGVLGISDIEGQVLMRIIGLGFQIIVIAMIVNSFPPELIHVHTTSFKNMIIGCGDVVKNRLRPALRKRQAVISYVFATDKDKDSEEFCTVASEEKIKKEIIHFTDDETIVWIETPSNKHIDYLKFMLDENVRCRLVVLEKPMAVSLNELEFIDEHIKKSYDDNIFFLSYYILEKALPLYMYYKYNHAYNKYLDIYTEVSADDVEEDGKEAFKKLPQKSELKKITVTLHEKDPEKRKWVGEAGGQACETFIHNMLIASLFVGVPDNWKIKKYDKTRNHLEATLLKDSNENLKLNNDVEIVLDMQKGTTTSKREAVLEFSNNCKLICNFDEKSLYICEKDCKKENRKLAIKVKKMYDEKYAILTDLVARVANDECECEDVDGRINQIECLKWLISQS